MAHWAIKSLQESLSHLIKIKSINNVDHISCAREELKLLESDVALFEAFADQEAPNNEAKSRIKKEVERQIIDVVHEVEDAIDICLSTQLAPPRKGGAKINQLVQVVRSLREDELKPVFDTIERLNNFDWHSVQGSCLQRTQVEKVPFATRTKVPSVWQESNNVGLESDEEKLTDYLLEQSDGLGVITLFGVPGIGKTTLAWSVYRSQKIQYEFPTRIWMNASQGLDSETILLNILKQLSSDDMSSLSEQQLLEIIGAHLNESRFLLVIDDVTSAHTWNAINNICPRQNRTGKVLITTRSRLISSHAHSMTKRNPYNMRRLTDVESWVLLQLKVFGMIGKCPPELKQTGEYIVRQCQGLPRVIVLIAGILRAQLVATEQNNEVAAQEAWIRVYEFVRAIDNMSFESILLETAVLVYFFLPCELSDCFLYLGVFPEDYEIPTWTLTRLWIAEGFIHPKDGQSLEEAAEEKLEELIIRNLLTVDKMSGNGQVKTCRVPKATRKFCCSKASDQNLFVEIVKSKKGFSYRTVCRRLIIHSNTEKFLSTEPKSHFARSFLCFDEEPGHVLNPKYISAIPDGFRLLRVLDSNKSIKFHQFPKGIVKLIHLRYLTLSGDNLHVLPEAISQLWNLQTIVVDTMSRRLTVRANIWKMILLRHLKTSASIILDIKDDEEEGLCDHHQNLQTLTRLSPEYCTENVFSRARNLKTLAIFGKLSNFVDAKSLLKLKRLENLKLVNDLFYEHTPIDELIQPNCFPTGLKKLTLSATFLKWEHMSTVLAKVETLEVLKLKDSAFTGRFWNSVGDDGFSSLRFLMIRETDLVSWEASGEYFPVLECLVLKNCQKLGEIPVGLAKSLHTLDIDRLGKSAVESARKIEEEKTQFGCAFKLSVGPGCE